MRQTSAGAALQEEWLPVPVLDDVASGTLSRAATEAPGRALDALVEAVLGDPDNVPAATLAEAVRGLEQRADAALGDTRGDARVVLERRFARALTLCHRPAPVRG